MCKAAHPRNFPCIAGYEGVAVKDPNSQSPALASLPKGRWWEFQPLLMKRGRWETWGESIAPCFTPSLGSPSRHGQFSLGNVTSEVTSCAHAEMRRWRLGEMMRLSCLHQASASCQHWLCGAVCRAPGRMSPAVSCRRRTPWFRKHSGTDHRSSSEEARSCLGHLHSAESLL